MGSDAHYEQMAQSTDTHKHWCPKCEREYECPFPTVCDAPDGDDVHCLVCEPIEYEQ